VDHSIADKEQSGSGLRDQAGGCARD